jgi:acyl carrier protein
VSVENRIRAIIVDQLKCKPDEVVLSARLQDDLQADSLDVVEIAITLEDEYWFRLTAQEMNALKTVSDLIKLVNERGSTKTSQQTEKK